MLGIHIDPNLSWSIQVEELRKKLLKRIAVLARIKKYLPIKYRILLFNASIRPILEYCVTVWGNCNAGQLDILFKIQERCARIILNKDYRTRSLALFKKIGWSPVNQICVAKRLSLFKRITENMAPEYLVNKLTTFKSANTYNLWSTLPYRLPKPNTNSLKRIFFYGSMKKWKELEKKINLNSRGLVKEFSKFTINQYTPDTFKIDTVF